MSYEKPFDPKPNTGGLFVNTYKKTDDQPDMRGDLVIDKTFLINMMDKSKGANCKISVAAWKKQSSGGKKYLSLSVSEPYVAPATTAKADPWE
jgi:hypothetical protein